MHRFQQVDCLEKILLICISCVIFYLMNKCNHINEQNFIFGEKKRKKKQYSETLELSSLTEPKKDRKY